MLVGILFLILGGLDINDPEHQNTANILNNTATVRNMMSIIHMKGNEHDLFELIALSEQFPGSCLYHHPAQRRHQRLQHTAH